MALTPSTMIPLGTVAPQFSLHEPLTDKMISFMDVRGEVGTVVMFICNHCPYVKYVQEELVRLANDYASQGVGFVAINSNDVENYPADSPKHMAADVRRLSYPFSYVFDKTQDVARSYGAVCTPDFFVYDSADALVYRGQLDDSRPGSNAPTGTSLRAALDALIADNPPLSEQKPSVGCGIKWN